MNVNDMAKSLTPEIYDKFREAIAIGKWPDGKVLSASQKEICIQAIIAYEYQNVPAHERTGYVPPKTEPCAHHNDESPIKWQL